MNTTTKTSKQRTPEQKAARRERERAQREAKKLAIHEAEFAARTGITMGSTDASWQTVDVDGTEVKVAASLSPAEAEKAARKLLGSKAELAAAQAEEAEAAAKPETPVRRKGEKRTDPSLPAGHVKFPLSTSAYKVLLEADLDSRIIKALKLSDKVRSETKAVKPPYHFPIMTLEDTATCATVLEATSKDWQKLTPAERGGSLASINRYAEQLRGISTGA